MIHGGFNAVASLATGVVSLFILGLVGAEAGQSDASAVIFVSVVVLFFITLFLVLFGLLPFFAGYGLWKRRAWGKKTGIAASLITALIFPFGTMLCAYTLWFLLGEGRAFYDGPPARLGASGRESLNEGDARAWAKARGKRAEYAPPPQMPNWRDDS